jgi:hypothetical protein
VIIALSSLSVCFLSWVLDILMDCEFGCDLLGFRTFSTWVWCKIS